MKCRHCQSALTVPFINLETSPPSNSYLTASQLAGPEKWYPLRVYTCTHCWLVQTEDYAHFSEMFSSDYAYFSSFSTSWLQHAERYVDQMASLLGLGPESHVVEVASNDGYLLQYVKARGIPCLGVEPTTSTAQAARDKGIEVIEKFFGVELAQSMVERGQSADLSVANNVLAHVPDINDFVAGFTRLLKPNGIATFEFPHLMQLVEKCQFDTIYHEHFSYLSLHTVRTVFAANGLSVFDVQEIPTHGGSLRVFSQRADTGARVTTRPVFDLLEREHVAGVATEAYYGGFQERVNRIKDDLVSFLIQTRRNNKSVGAYGAAAKGNTLLNYGGVRSSLLPWVVDRNPAKQGKFMPGSRIEIVDEDHLRRTKPDFVLILPWNLKTEVTAQLDYIKEWGGRFVTAVPHIEVL